MTRYRLAGSIWVTSKTAVPGTATGSTPCDVVFTGFVAGKDLPGLYANASLFVFPSLYEGFGIPVLEAMAAGTPACVANVSSLPEVAGDAALLFDPHDAESIATSMLRVLGDDVLRARLRARGLQRVRQFTWERSARGVVDACRAAVAACA